MASYKYSVYNSKNRGRANNRGRSGGNKRRGEYINPSRFVQVARQQLKRSILLLTNLVIFR